MTEAISAEVLDDEHDHLWRRLDQGVRHWSVWEYRCNFCQLTWSLDAVYHRGPVDVDDRALSWLRAV